jgi:predicted ABC-type ATPase
VQRRESFAFETTLSGLGYVARIRQWRSMGYEVSLCFLNLPSPEMAILRVAARVRQGGHAIPESVIRRRFAAGLSNLETTYKFEVNHRAQYDNVGDCPVLIDWGEAQRDP